MSKTFRAILLACVIAAPTAVPAQVTGIPFGDLRQDTSLPVEIAADQLAVDQADGSATFSGNVLVGQGTMRLGAEKVRVEYAPDGGSIIRLHATGKVTLVNGAEAAEAQEAVYTIDTGTVVMTGDVLLTQGANVLSGQRLVVDLRTGSGTMEGRVQSVFTPGATK